MLSRKILPSMQRLCFFCNQWCVKGWGDSLTNFESLLNNWQRTSTWFPCKRFIIWNHLYMLWCKIYFSSLICSIDVRYENGFYSISIWYWDTYRQNWYFCVNVIEIFFRYWSNNEFLTTNTILILKHFSGVL